MPETRLELGRAVTEVLERLNVSPETAGAALGINGKMLAAMAQGIVPMRSLVIRFADGLSKHCRDEAGIPEWWSDADAWLRLAGYPPRQDTPPNRANRENNGGERPDGKPKAPGAWQVRPQPERAPAAAGRFAPAPFGSAQVAHRPAPSPEDDRPAREFYRPVYERKSVGDAIVHIFQIVDTSGQKVFERSLSANADYRAEAAKVKQDLAALSRIQFERKYGRFRVGQ